MMELIHGQKFDYFGNDGRNCAGSLVVKPHSKNMQSAWYFRLEWTVYIWASVGRWNCARLMYGRELWRIENQFQCKRLSTVSRMMEDLLHWNWSRIVSSHPKKIHSYKGFPPWMDRAIFHEWLSMKLCGANARQRAPPFVSSNSSELSNSSASSKNSCW